MLHYLLVNMVDVKQNKQTNREVTKIQPTCLYSQICNTTMNGNLRQFAVQRDYRKKLR